MPYPPPDQWQKQIINYQHLEGGVNFLVADSNISEDPQRLEFASQINFENFRKGSLIQQGGNVQLNLTTTDKTRILGIGEFITNTKRYIMYTKASGDVYAYDFDAQIENLVVNAKSTVGIPNFIPFNGHIVVFNGVDRPWEWDGVVGHAATFLSGVPVAWLTGQPKFGGVISGHIVVVCDANVSAGATVYGCALGDENQWDPIADPTAFAFSTPFSDITNFTAVRNYGQNILFYTGLPAIYLLTGTTTDNFQIVRMATNRSSTTNLATDTIDNKQWFFSGDAIVNVQTTQFGTILMGFGEDLILPIKPLFTDDFVFQINNVNRFEIIIFAILLAYYQRNYLMCYFQSNQSLGDYDICAVFDFNNKAWFFRQATPISAAWQFQKTYLITGTDDGRLLQEFEGNSLYDGSALGCSLRTPWFQWGQPANKKLLLMGWFWFTTAAKNSNITFNVRVDFEDLIVFTYTYQGLINSNAVYDDDSNYDTNKVYAIDEDGLLELPIDVQGRAIQIEILNNDINSQFTLREFSLVVEMQDDQ